MATDIIIHKEWDIPNDLKRKFSEKTLKEILHAFNAMSGGSYFFFDHYRKKLIIDTPDSWILCGHPKALAQKEGFGFFQHILEEKELNRLKKLWRLTADFFFDLDEDECKDFILFYDMSVKTKNGEKIILHHKVVPFQLCENANLWLALGCVSPSVSQKTEHKACVINRATKKRHDLIKNKFVDSDIIPLTSEERKILQLLVKNMLEPNICEALSINKSKYHRLKTVLFEKLKASTPGGAVHIAHHLGLI